jgi:hypothetical protein
MKESAERETSPDNDRRCSHGTSGWFTRANAGSSCVLRMELRPNLFAQSRSWRIPSAYGLGASRSQKVFRAAGRGVLRRM